MKKMFNKSLHGIIMAGGLGTRLHPSTKVINKHLLPVFDKPMIYYPLTTLLATGIKEITIIINPGDYNNFCKILGHGETFGCEINYVFQANPGGIPEGLILAEQYIASRPTTLILGDNLLIGKGLGRDLMEYTSKSGCRIFGAKVSDPQHYGVAELSLDGDVIGLEEKPSRPKSDIAIPGLYFFDSTAIERAKKLTPSSRGELEVLDLLRSYMLDEMLFLKMLERGSTWLDCGTHDQLLAAGNLVKMLQDRQGLTYGNPADTLNYG